MSKQAEAIVAVVLKDLHDRQVVGDDLDTIRDEYPDNYAQLVKELQKLVDAVLIDYQKPSVDVVPLAVLQQWYQEHAEVCEMELSSSTCCFEELLEELGGTSGD